jgi:YggT family protein
MERTLLRAGGQPGTRPWWTLAAVVVGGLALLSIAEFVVGQVAGASFAVAQGPRGVVVLLVTWTFQVLRLALMARVLGSWFGQGRWSRWTRWAYALTDWFMAPLARVVPPLGMLDLTPLVAYFGLGLLQSVVLRALV